ncbi:MAG: 4a-hydroxytetrahydrobiopterin dehydratase [Burkholderiales bacterium]|nr:4a-hydroxytetrahydrobiopterin dehydratase [Burkholderiales bacterium]
MADLTKKHCAPCEGGTPPLSQSDAAALLKSIPGWMLKGNQIDRSYQFKNYYETMAFVNAAAWISHREDHHPDMLVSYNQCRVTYTTHAISGLSENDFICAAKLDALWSV